MRTAPAPFSSDALPFDTTFSRLLLLLLIYNLHDFFQVYNWQFVHSIHLWVQLLGDTKSDVLEPLLYPLVQLISGTIRLNYTSRHYPLRFHLSHLLTELSEKSGKFIPILPYFLDILHSQNFGKKKGQGKNASGKLKPMDFSCILRLSKSQLGESGFRDATVDAIFSGISETLACYSHKISFPELAFPATIQLKAFMKKCKAANYCKKMKTLVEKIGDNVKFIQVLLFRLFSAHEKITIF